MRSFPLRAAGLAATLCLAPIVASPALAFSQITGPDGEATTRQGGIVSAPLPPVPGSQAAPQGAPGGTPGEAPGTAGSGAGPTPPTGEAAPTAGGPAEVEAAEDDPALQSAPPSDVPPAEIFYGEDTLPAPVRDVRRKLMEVARDGEIERLRALMEPGPEGTVVTTSQDGEDPIEVLKNASGDGNGVEILAILLETLEAGYVHLDPGGENDIFVWPYFTQVNLETLTKPQLVELFELVTAGDYERMVGNGSYDFYRVGISPDGRFEFFIAGD